MNTENKNEVTWLDEVSAQEFDEEVYGACSTNTFSLSDYWGNNGNWCTISHECMAWCKQLKIKNTKNNKTQNSKNKNHKKII